MAKGLDLGTIEGALAEHFPDLVVAPLRELDRGFGSLAVETGYGVVFRIARHASAAEGHAGEAALLSALRSRLPVAVPDPRWRVEAGDARLPFGAVGYRKLPGQALSPGRLAQAPSIAAELAAFLVGLHAFPVHEAEALEVPRDDGDGAELEALRDTVLPILRDALPEAELRLVLHWFDELLVDRELHRFVPTVRHGDLWYGNVLVDEAGGTLSGVVDWENAAMGDPAKDLARQLHLGSSFANAVLRAYEARRGGRDPGLRHRIARRWELLEFSGIRTAAALDDPDELEETLAKLRAGPILRPNRRFQPR